jgi:hypothetical protein
VLWEGDSIFPFPSIARRRHCTCDPTAYDAAKFIVEGWPPERGGPKLSNAKVILLKCLAGECSAAVARVAFIEAARESYTYIAPPEIEPLRGKPRWRKAKAWRIS